MIALYDASVVEEQRQTLRNPPKTMDQMLLRA